MVKACIYEDNENYDDEVLDPRIEGELEKLNSSASLMNQLNLDLDDAQNKLRSLCKDSETKLGSLYKKHSMSIEKSRPYYDSRICAKKASAVVEECLAQVEQADCVLTSATEIYTVAMESSNGMEGTSDTWREMIASAKHRVKLARSELADRQEALRHAQKRLHASESEVKKQLKYNGRAISKSKAYYELMASYKPQIETAESHILKVKTELKKAKNLYSTSLTNLEEISISIHEMRMKSQSLLSTDSGVGSDSGCELSDTCCGGTPAATFSLGSLENLTELVTVGDSNDSDETKQLLKDNMTRERSSSCPAPHSDLLTKDSNTPEQGDDNSQMTRTNSLPDITEDGEISTTNNIDGVLDDSAVDEALSYNSAVRRAFKLSDYAKMFEANDSCNRLSTENVSRHQKYFTLRRDGTLKLDSSPPAVTCSFENL